MNVIEQTWLWLSMSGHWQMGWTGIPGRLLQHGTICFLAVTCSSAVACPLGLIVSRYDRLCARLIRASVVVRSIPTLGTIALAGAVCGRGIFSAFVALVVLAFPTIFIGTISGITAIPSDVRRAGLLVGMTSWQVRRYLDIPLAFPSIMAAWRASMLQVVSTATLCAYVSDVGLGIYLFDGLKRHDNGELFGCTVLVVTLVLSLDTALSFVQRRVFRRYRPA